MLTAVWTCEPDKHSGYRVGVSATYYTTHGYAVKDKIICEFVAKLGCAFDLRERSLIGLEPKTRAAFCYQDQDNPYENDGS